MRLVIVDDHPLLREVLRLTLETRPDIEIVGEASNGTDAIRVCEELQPEMVIMDLRLPDMDGFRAIKQIRKTCQSVKSILLTSSMEEIADKAKTAGFDAVLPKYGTLNQLVEVLQQFINSYRNPLLITNLTGTDIPI